VAPDGQTLENRLDDAKVTFTAAGENLAISVDPVTAHKALLASPGHRENIMDTEYARMGVAAVSYDSQRIVYVEEFAN
jgi:uncharacterized protein YkwD